MPEVSLSTCVYLHVMVVTSLMQRIVSLEPPGRWTEAECAGMTCLNDGICEHKTNNKDEASAVSCQCTPLYFGKRCNHRISVSHLKTTARSIEFEVTSSTGDVTEANKNEVFSLVQWSNFTYGVSCSFDKNIQLGNNVIKNLKLGTAYTICVYSGVMQWCSFVDESQNVPGNCIKVKTKEYDDKLPVHILPVVIASLALVLVFIVILVVLRCYRKLCFSDYKQITQRESHRKHSRRKNKSLKDDFKIIDDSPFSLGNQENSADFLLPPQSSPAEEFLRTSFYDQDAQEATYTRNDAPSQRLLGATRNYTSTFFAQNDQQHKLSPVLEFEPRSKSDSNLLEDKGVTFLSPGENEFPPPPSLHDIQVLTSSNNQGESNA